MLLAVTFWEAAPVAATIAGTLLAAIALIRTHRVQEAQERSEDAEKSAAASVVGLEYLKTSILVMQETITRQEGVIGRLEGMLTECRDERTALAREATAEQSQIAELVEKIAVANARLDQIGD